MTIQTLYHPANGNEVYKYVWPLSDSFADAIVWHGDRYEVSHILCRHIVWDDDGTNRRLEFRECAAWNLREAWESEGPLSCGSPALNGFLQDCIDEIV